MLQLSICFFWFLTRGIQIFAFSWGIIAKKVKRFHHAEKISFRVGDTEKIYVLCALRMHLLQNEELKLLVIMWLNLHKIKQMDTAFFK